MLLRGKAGLVTGAGRGIGKAIAMSLAKEGCDVAVNDIDLHSAEEVAKKIRNLGRRSIAVKSDVSNAGEVSSMVKTITENLQKIRILVNNAGIGVSSPILETSEDNWDRVMDVNLKGVFLTSKFVAQEMIKQDIKGGSIINIASVSAEVPVPFLAAYSPSKAGVVSLSKLLAMELAEFGIRVNSISPGFIRTPMTEPIYKDQQIEAKRSELVPMNRIGTPEDIAKLAVFLASDNSSYITGQNITVDGGLGQAWATRLPGVKKYKFAFKK